MERGRPQAFSDCGCSGQVTKHVRRRNYGAKGGGVVRGFDLVAVAEAAVVEPSSRSVVVLKSDSTFASRLSESCQDAPKRLLGLFKGCRDRVES